MEKYNLYIYRWSFFLNASWLLEHDARLISRCNIATRSRIRFHSFVCRPKLNISTLCCIKMYRFKIHLKCTDLNTFLNSTTKDVCFFGGKEMICLRWDAVNIDGRVSQNWQNDISKKKNKLKFHICNKKRKSQQKKKKSVSNIESSSNKYGDDSS